MFKVYDNGKEANCFGYKVHESWDAKGFETFEAALIYARKWIAPYGGSYDGTDGVILQLNKPYDYSGYGDFIEIREEK